MSNALTQVRSDLAGVLTAAQMFAFVTVPESARPPLTFVGPGSPYVTYEGAVFGGEIVRCSVVVVASTGTNDVAAEELDAMVLTVLDAIAETDAFLVGDVDQPGQLAINGQPHLAVSIEVQTEIHR